MSLGIEHEMNTNGHHRRRALPVDLITQPSCTDFHHIKLSPDGHRVAMLNSSNGQLCVMMNLSNSSSPVTMQQITNSGMGLNISAGTEYGGDVLCWAHDSKSVFICSNHSGDKGGDSGGGAQHATVHTPLQDSLAHSRVSNFSGTSGVFQVFIDNDQDELETPVKLVHQTYGNKFGAVMRPCTSNDGKLVAFVVEELMYNRMALYVGRCTATSEGYQCVRMETPPQWSFIYDPVVCPSEENDERRRRLIATSVWSKPNMHWDDSRIMVLSLASVNDLTSPKVAYLPQNDNVKAYCTQPKFSPDGKFLSYLSDERGDHMELMIVPVRNLFGDEHGSDKGVWKPTVISASEGCSNFEVNTRAWITGTSSYDWLSDNTLVVSRFNHAGVVVELVHLQLTDGEGFPAIAGQRATRILTNYSGVFENFIGCSPMQSDSINSALKFTCSFTNFETVQQNMLVEVEEFNSGMEQLKVKETVLTSSGTRFPRSVQQRLAPLIPFQYPLSSCVDETGIATGYGQVCLSNNKADEKYDSLDAIVKDFKDSRSLPMFVWVHGGPNGQSADRFTPVVQYFATRGWLVFLPNYRGSYGFGRVYRQALNGRWGQLDISDTFDGVKFLEDLGIVDPNKIVIAGPSAGGSTVVSSMALHPNTYAAGVTMCGVIDFVSFASGGSHILEDHYMTSLVGSIPHDLDQIQHVSPLNRASKITGALMILHGESDSVVPAYHSEMLHQKIKSTVEYVTYEGVRHSMSAHKPTLRDMLLRMERFFSTHVLKS